MGAADLCAADHTGLSSAGGRARDRVLLLVPYPVAAPASLVHPGADQWNPTATGYLIGVSMGVLVRPLTHWRPSASQRRKAWVLVALLGAMATTAFSYNDATWQRDLHALMGSDAPRWYSYLGIPPLAGAVFTALVGVARTLRALEAALRRYFGRWVPRALARLLAVVGVVVLVLGLLEGVVTRVLLIGANNAFKTLNSETDPGTAPPQSPELSGSPASLVSWASLGRFGRDFVTTGPSLGDLEGFSGKPAAQPIRVYVGLDAAEDPEERAELAVRELDRTGAFGREVLCVITTTGTGWIDSLAVDPLEYMYNGDTALVALQYSYLPSWISWVVDRDRARAAGRDLFNQVYARWSELPPDGRPKLLVYGKSLGAFGAEAAFSGIDDIINRTDGALLVGAPNDSTLWQEFVSGRERSTKEVLPTFERGETVRFAIEPEDLRSPPTRWTFPRIAYLQHASDPVVWWSPRLLLNKPDWLSEERGPDVLPRTRWYPFVTFWQLTADLTFATRAPPGHGHNYGSEEAAMWALIAPPPGWSQEQEARLKAIIKSALDDMS